MKRLLALLLLAGCDNPPQSPSPDKYTYERTEWVRNDVTVSVVTYPSGNALRKAAKKLKVDAGEGRSLMAFTFVKGTNCSMHVVEPSIDYQPQWIGHEMTHCIRGRWHK